MFSRFHCSTLRALSSIRNGSNFGRPTPRVPRPPCSLRSNEAREDAEELLYDMEKHAAAARCSAGLSRQREPRQHFALSKLAVFQTNITCLRKALSDREAQANPRAAARRAMLHEGR